MAIDVPLEIYVSAAEAPGVKVDWCDGQGPISGLPAFGRMIDAFMSTLGDPASNGWRVGSLCRARAGAGLGTSGAFAVAVAALMLPGATAHEIASAAYAWEHEQGQRVGVGPQDSYASAYGGVHVFDIDRSMSVTAQRVDLHNRTRLWVANNLLLFDSGGTRDASRLGVARDPLIPDTERSRRLDAIRGLVSPLRHALSCGAVEKIGPLLTENWNLKRGLSPGVSTRTAQRLLDLCLASGAQGGKLIGAGGGGFVLVSVPDDSLQSVRAEMTTAGAAELAFDLARTGVTRDCTHLG